MKSLRTYKLKITSDTTRFAEIAIAYRYAFNWLSPIVFAKGKPTTPNKLSNEFYGTVRANFGLPSQVTCSLFRHVVSTYRSMKTNGNWTLAILKKTVVPLCWRRDFAISNRGTTIWGKPITYHSRPLPEGKWSDSKLKCINGQWYLCLVLEIDVLEPKTEGGVIGVDRGQKNVLTAFDSKTGKTLYVRGGPLNHRKLCIRQTRAKVASVGTRSAHRLLQRLSGKEKSVTQEMMHVASKRLVTFAKECGARSIAMENLIGFKDKQTCENKKQHHKQRARNNRWPYWMLDFFASYKAAAIGIGTEYVPAKNTSRGCPKCGHVSKSNRNGLEFRCLS